ncbi:MAG: hypothetical protein VKJ46_15840 [Leptolyngbyaceae bacterium]|nr:hypothetical protein [Leptolyngbyaceae bacterium]
MKTSPPDIIVTSPDGDYLIIVEVKPNDVGSRKEAIEQLRYLMAKFGCSVGLVVTGGQIVLLRDSFKEPNGESVHIASEAKLPDFLLPPADEQWKGEPRLEFESRVQRWLENLKRTTNLDNFPDDLKALLSEPILSLLRLGEVRAARPRWSKVAS